MLTKSEVYAKYGIVYKDEKIDAPVFGMISPLVKVGNTKTGRACFTYSTLPTNRLFDAAHYSKDLRKDMDAAGVHVISGTCNCNCKDAYCKTGHYNHENVLASLFRNTFLQRNYPDWTARAIRAQIEADKIQIFRIHAVGDLEKEAQDLFLNVCSETQGVQYWTYTKITEAENGPLASLPNVNIVRSITPDGRVNFGKCGDIARLYRSMKAAGYKVYLCPCGIDKEHDVKCADCRICAEYDYVLFIMHSVKEYDPKKDPDLHLVYKILDEQNAGR